MATTKFIIWCIVSQKKYAAVHLVLYFSYDSQCNAFKYVSLKLPSMAYP